MHVCMISGYAGVGGGLETVVDELTRFLANHNVQVTVFKSSSRDLTHFYPNVTVEELRPYNILPSKLQFAQYDRYSYSLKVWVRIKQSKHFDLVHGHGDHCFFPALFRDRSPLITNIHGVKKAYRRRVFGPDSSFVKGPRVLPIFWPEEISAKRSNLTVACSKAERNELISNYGIDTRKIQVIYNGVNIDKFKPVDKRTARKLLGLPETCNYAIWVGNNPSLKGLRLAIDAVKDIPNLYLLVAGTSGVNFGNVLFFGMVKDSEKLCALYNAADFLIFPTLYEGFPIVPLEAMACGLPIIISKECPTREIIKDGVEGFVIEERKPASYTEKIMTLLADYSQNHETSVNCRKLAENYNWGNVGKKYLELYSRMVI
jgi:glycosyltransferase involved in cell wall biosynthesis